MKLHQSCVLVGTLGVALALSACGSKEEKKSSKKSSSGPTASDMSGLDIMTEMLAIVPSGTLSYSGRSRTTYASPCAGEGVEGTDYPAGSPARNTVECTLRETFADPDVYTDVGGAGFFESIKIMANGIVPLAKNCKEPLAKAKQSITIGALDQTGTFACSQKPAIADMVQALVDAKVVNETADQLEQAFADANVVTTWGETATRKNLLLGFDFGSAKADKGLWLYIKDKDSGEIQLHAAQANTQSDEGRRVNIYSTRRAFVGNPTTHAFQGIIRSDGITQSQYYAIRTKGVKADGEYYYVDIIATDITADGTPIGVETPAEFCFDSTTNAQVDASNCATYKTALADVDFFASADMPQSMGDVVITDY